MCGPVGTPVPELSQDAEELDLKWRSHDVVNMTFTVADVDWAGTYKAQVRDRPSRKGALLAELNVTATLVDGDTLFTLALADSSTVPNGGFWDLQQVGGPTRLAGRVIVVQDVTI